MAETAYYLSDFSDEVMPCGTSLEAWSKWLSAPDPEWGRHQPALNGDTFFSHVYQLHQVTAVKRAGRWELQPDAPKGTEFMALRYGDGLGWDAEMLVENLDDLQDVINGEISCHPDAGYFICCGVPQPSVTLTFNDGDLTANP